MSKVYVCLSYNFRFIVFIFGPKGISNYVEIGRCIATMMIDEVSKHKMELVSFVCLI